MLRNAARFGALAALIFCAGTARAQIEGIPRYDHILVIILENHGFDLIIENPIAPNIDKLAKKYGLAAHYYGVVHPSKANYIAMIAGQTFGIHDDEPYTHHTLDKRSLVDQLEERNLTWKGYYQNIHEPGSKAVAFPDPQSPVPDPPSERYVAKHNAFINFSKVQKDQALLSKMVDFDQLFQDLFSGQMPNYAHIVPDQCHNMHGVDEKQHKDVPKECGYGNNAGRIAGGDEMIGDLVAKIQASPIWSAQGNTAIVITWDEDHKDQHHKGEGCCGFEPTSEANFGGGHVPTLVITNHGPGHVVDDTLYNHYSLLRTTEAAFGITEFLNLAGRADKGVKTMAKLFAVK